MIERLKRLRAKARRQLADARHRRNEHQARRKKARRNKRGKVKARAAARQHLRFLEHEYNNLELPGDSATEEEVEEWETKAHRLKAKMRDERERIDRIDKDLRDLRARIRNLSRITAQTTRRIRWLVGTRLPHINRRLKKAIREAKADKLSPTGSSVVTFDGKPCAEWLAYRCRVGRAAGWDGILVSGWRSPEYSESLCYRMCGAPTCPGRCAGRYSNHAKKDYPYGAIDVSDYYNFGAIMRNLDSRIPGVHIYNALGAADPVHFSSSGR